MEIFKDKGLIYGILATIILIGGGIFLMTRGQSNSTNSPNTSSPVSQDILAPSGVFTTSGFSNGQYLTSTSSAKIQIVEFGDYQCPACSAYQPIIKQVLSEFAGKINYVFRDFAFVGSESIRAAEASYCASDQNKFWEFHEYLYSHQGAENKGAFSDANLKLFAQNLGLDSKSFASCLDSGKYKSKVDSSSNDANLAGINSTPTFFINGVKLQSLPNSFEEFKSLIDSYSNK